MNFELLSPPRYGSPKLHVGIVGTEVSLCERPTANWMIMGAFDVLRVTCPICRKRVEMHLACSDKDSTDGVVV